MIETETEKSAMMTSDKNLHFMHNLLFLISLFLTLYQVQYFEVNVYP